MFPSMRSTATAGAHAESAAPDPRRSGDGRSQQGFEPGRGKAGCARRRRRRRMPGSEAMTHDGRCGTRQATAIAAIAAIHGARGAIVSGCAAIRSSGLRVAIELRRGVWVDIAAGACVRTAGVDDPRRRHLWLIQIGCSCHRWRRHQQAQAEQQDEGGSHRHGRVQTAPRRKKFQVVADHHQLSSRSVAPVRPAPPRREHWTVAGRRHASSDGRSHGDNRAPGREPGRPVPCGHDARDRH